MGVLSVVLALLLSSTLSSFWNKLVSQSTPVGFFFFFFLEEREVYCRAVQGEWGLMPPKSIPCLYLVIPGPHIR